GGAVQQLELHELLFFIQPDAALTRKVDRRFGLPGGGGDEYVAPAALGWQLADVNHLVRKVLEEHTRTHIAFHTCGHHDIHNLAITLIRTRKGEEGFVGGADGSEAADEQDGPRQAHQTDAARLHGDEFAIRREAA